MLKMFQFLTIDNYFLVQIKEDAIATDQRWGLQAYIKGVYRSDFYAIIDCLIDKYRSDMSFDDLYDFYSSYYWDKYSDYGVTKMSKDDFEKFLPSVGLKTYIYSDSFTDPIKCVSTNYNNQ